MQRNDMALKRKLLYDGEEKRGLVETSAISDEEGLIESPGFDRTVDIKNGVKKFAPLDLVYKIERDVDTKSFFRDWFYKNEFHDVTVINTDGVGREVDRWLLRDCECSLFDERAYNAGGVEFFGIGVRVTCSATPVPLDAS